MLELAHKDRFARETYAETEMVVWKFDASSPIGFCTFRVQKDHLKTIAVDEYMQYIPCNLAILKYNDGYVDCV